MKGGFDLQKYVDVLLPAAPATIKIVQVRPLEYTGFHLSVSMVETFCNPIGNLDLAIQKSLLTIQIHYTDLGSPINISRWTDAQHQGNGPVHLVGSHCVEKMVEEEEREDEAEEEESQEDEDSSDDKSADKCRAAKAKAKDTA